MSGQTAIAAPMSTSEKWSRYLGDMRSYLNDRVALETQGLLVRVTGLVLEAAGIRVPVGSVCEVRMEGQTPVIAEVVGFSGDRAYLMPTGDVDQLRDNVVNRLHLQCVDANGRQVGLLADFD